MRDYLVNPHIGTGLKGSQMCPQHDVSDVTALLGKCPKHAWTPLLDLPDLADQIGVAQVHLKDERN